MTEEELLLPVGMTNNIPEAAVDTVKNHLGRVVHGLCNDLLLTLGNSTVNRFTSRKIGATVGISRDTSATQVMSPISGVSLAE